MSFKTLTSEDFLISTDTISATLWSGATPVLSTFFTSSTQEASSAGDYYLNVYQTASTLTNAEIQFAIAYGNKNGSGSNFYNSQVTGSSPTRTIYGQYRTLIYGDEYANFTFGAITSSDFWVISLDRTRYKEKLFLGSLNLRLSGSGGNLNLTDNSQVVNSITFTDAGRVFQIVSGSSGAVYTSGSNTNGYSPSFGSYGLFLPDIATIILNPTAISESIRLVPSYSFDSEGFNNRRLFTAISGAASFGLNNEETISSDYVFVRVKNSEFNYTENPSFISGSTGEVLYNLFINSPQTYITTIGMYNDTNDLVAVAKLSRPLLKDFTKEALIRVKLDW
jgi:hypothetical protein